MIGKGLRIIVGDKQFDDVIQREWKPSKKEPVVQFLQVKMDSD